MPKKPQSTRTIWMILLLAGLLYTLNRVDRLADNPVTQVMAQAIAYPSRAVHSLENSATSHWDRYIDLRGAKEEAMSLKTEMESRRLELSRLNELEAENRRLRELLDFSRGYRLDYVAAHVISHDTSPVFHRFLIDRGSADGFAPGMPALCREGAAGRLGRVLGPNLSEVIFLNDPESRVDAFIGEGRIRTVVRGGGHGVLKGLYVEWDQPVQVGDAVVTSGMAGVFPKGMRIGTVEKSESRQGDLFLDVQIRPLIEFEHLEEVLILQPDVHPEP